MKIDKDTTLQGLCQIGFIDKEVYLFLKDEGFNVVNDIISTKDSKYWFSKKNNIRSFYVFLLDIIEFIHKYENKRVYENIEIKLPHSLLFTIQSIFEKEKKIFNVDHILSLNLDDKSSSFAPSFYYQLISDPFSLFDIETFKNNYKGGENVIIDVDIEYEQYKAAMTSVIVNIKNALENFPDCLYYDKLIEVSIKELGISEKHVLDAGVPASEHSMHSVNVEMIEPNTNPAIIYNKIEDQNKYEEFQENLSARTRKIIGINIPRYSDFMPWVLGKRKEFNFRGGGKKTIMELENLLQNFRDYYTHNTYAIKEDYKNDANYVKSLSYLIELGIERKKYNIDAYKCLLELYPKWDDFVVEMSNMDILIEKIYKYAPKQTLDCLMWLTDLFLYIFILIDNNDEFKKYISVFSSANASISTYIENNKKELEFQKYITDAKEILITKIFNQLVSGTSVQCQNAISNYNFDYKTLLTYEGREIDFRNLRQVGKKCALELSNLLNDFIPKYREILVNEDNIAKAGYIYSKFPFLNARDMKFVRSFENGHQHFPMFYILFRYFENTSNRSAEIFASYCGLAGNIVFSMESLAERFNLTRERVRQIIKQGVNDADFEQLLDQKLWQSYNLDFDSFLSNKNSNYRILLNEEQVRFSFFSYCNLLSLFKRIKVLNVSVTGKVLSSPEVEKYIEENTFFRTYGYHYCLDEFKFNAFIKEVGRLLHLQRDIEIKIHIYSYFVMNPQYWFKEITFEDETVGKRLLPFLKVLIFDIYGTQVEDDYLILYANKINYPDVLYKILKDKGEKMHINEIYETFKSMYPDSKYDNARYLKNYLLNDERFEYIGKTSLYQLTEWGRYSGSIPDLIVKQVSQEQTPISIGELSKNVLRYRSDSTKKSVLSVIFKCIKEDKLVLYYGDYVGIKGRAYDSSFIILPQNFNDWLQAFKSFTLEHRCFPCGMGKGFEGALYNWYYDARSYINLSSDEIKAFHSLMQELLMIPHNVKERKFLNNCEAYKSFVKQTGRMLKKDDEEKLYSWFRKSLTRYPTYEDNRKKYFIDLIDYLHKNLHE